MKIVSSSISMASQHSLVEQDIQQESLQYWSDGRGVSQNQQTPTTLLAVPTDVVDISDQAKQMAEVKATQPELYELSEGDKQKIRLIQAFMEALSGKKIKFVLPGINSDEKLTLTLGELPRGRVAIAQAQPNYGWGLRYDAYQFHSEKESISFSAAGVAKTADGREINFAAQLNMTREFMSEQSISIRAGDALKDPLAINFDAPAAKLSTTKYSFDIDSDGTVDQISFTGPGSGFLALDVNGDGIINNGKELFGPESGNGFDDLSKYDSDGNNWIDESDAIYEKLRIWTKDSQGNDQLLALGQKGVGAIYLGNVDTQFAMKDSTNVQHGQLRRTGVFLRENGTVGTVQQVDLAV